LHPREAGRGTGQPPRRSWAAGRGAAPARRWRPVGPSPPRLRASWRRARGGAARRRAGGRGRRARRGPSAGGRGSRSARRAGPRRSPTRGRCPAPRRPVAPGSRAGAPPSAGPHRRLGRGAAPTSRRRPRWRRGWRGPSPANPAGLWRGVDCRPCDQRHHPGQRDLLRHQAQQQQQRGDEEPRRGARPAPPGSERCQDEGRRQQVRSSAHPVHGLGEPRHQAPERCREARAEQRHLPLREQPDQQRHVGQVKRQVGQVKADGVLAMERVIDRQRQGGERAVEDARHRPLAGSVPEPPPRYRPAARGAARGRRPAGSDRPRRTLLRARSHAPRPRPSAPQRWR
jgi:hypothetical protein